MKLDLETLINSVIVGLLVDISKRIIMDKKFRKDLFHKGNVRLTLLQLRTVLFSVLSYFAAGVFLFTGLLIILAVPLWIIDRVAGAFGGSFLAGTPSGVYLIDHVLHSLYYVFGVQDPYVAQYIDLAFLFLVGWLAVSWFSSRKVSSTGAEE